MSVYNDFKYLNNFIAMTQERISNIAYRRERIANQLAYTFSCSPSTLYVGSYGRGTSNFRTSDIDLIFKLPWSVYIQYNAHKTNGQSNLLQAVKNSIALTYPQTNLKGDGQIVSVNFSDNMVIEVIPAFESTTDGSFCYPDSNNGGSWKWTYPRQEIEALREMDAQTSGNLKNLCKMIRQWRHHNNAKIKGALIDIFCYNFIKNCAYKTNDFTYYDWMTRDIFNYLKNIDPNQQSFKMPGSGRMITRGETVFTRKAEASHDAAINMVDFYAKNQLYSANLMLRSIYGIAIP